MSDFPLRDRTKALALRVIKLVYSLPEDDASRVIGRQLLRCGTSVGANYRASMRAKSPADMVNKLKIVEEEADETGYWLTRIWFPKQNLGRLERKSTKS